MGAVLEGTLIDRLKAGDRSAVADLSTAYGSKIAQLAIRYLKNREDAEEVAQDVLLKVYQKIDAFRGDAALSSWIYRITFNTVMSRLRDGKHNLPANPRGPARDEAGYEAPRRDVVDWSPLADEEVHRAQMRRALARALRDLPELYRTPVVLRDIHGLTTEEASAVLRVKVQTLKSRLHRGRLILRQRLAEFAGGLSLHPPAAVH
jgi:RNA polymerase sigma-70 factor (ECF subfamily)